MPSVGLEGRRGLWQHWIGITRSARKGLTAQLFGAHMIDKKRIETEAEHFFAWPTDDRTYVTRTSMLIFANVIAEMARTEEREACAKVCDPYTSGQWYAAAIRKRSNA